jgi:hypothetical protein
MKGALNDVPSLGLPDGWRAEGGIEGLFLVDLQRR